ncbi:MAG: hypothetical protein QOF15_1258, partial [Mycobacterium sp.]|nr:hypothetical protein [Mycobacterium sp.]
MAVVGVDGCRAAGVGVAGKGRWLRHEPTVNMPRSWPVTSIPVFTATTRRSLWRAFTYEIPESVAARDSTDRASGIENARASRQRLVDAARYALRRAGSDDLYDGHILVMGLASRAAGLHDGAVNALETDNPF